MEATDPTLAAAIGAADDAPGMPDFGPVSIRWERGIPGVLKIIVSGIGGDPEAALRRWRYNLALARDARLHKVLVVLDLRGPLIPEPQLASMIARVAEGGFDDFRVAVVQLRHERQPHDELGILIAIEHGLTARVFADEASALVWLRYGER